MKQQTRYRLAFIIFIMLLLYKLYGISHFFWIWISQDAYQAWNSLGHWEVSVFWFITRIVCVVITLIPLVTLTISAFKQKTNQRHKRLYAWFYVIGILVPWFGATKWAELRCPINPVFFNYFIIQGFPVICVLLFLFALYKLMQTKSEKGKEDALEADNKKIGYYENLLERKVITKDEFEDMKGKIKNGGLR